MKEYIAKDLGCKYRWNKEFKVLEYASEFIDGTYDEWGAVEEDLVGEEPVTFQGIDTDLSSVYRIVEKALGEA